MYIHCRRRAGRRVIVKSFDWDDDNDLHLGSHGITAEEAEYVISASRTVFKGHPRKANRYFAFGRTAAGRWLTLLFDFDEQTNCACAFTGWDMKPGALTKYAR